MNKIILGGLTLGLGLILLSGCQNRKDSADWLQGKWYSKTWDVTYTFSEEDDIWEIRSGSDGKVSKCSKEYTNESDKKEIELVSKQGTEFHITPINKTHIKFQQISKDGSLGTTDAVEFVKK
ncbi:MULTISPECIES: hypothetical protein [Lactococcus]|uniref:Phage protein n=1 Tax=Lactococcus lactis subsp. cremoris TaxID=1359 RepID=A0A166KID6_LACLC|nr:hypothetical protein [Lactococcus cremoris]KZK08408.1 Phage protein [Lactococcus cremoris]